MSCCIICGFIIVHNLKIYGHRLHMRCYSRTDFQIQAFCTSGEIVHQKIVLIITHPATHPISGGSRGGVVGAITPLDWSDKIDFFYQFSANISLTRLFAAFTDFHFSIYPLNGYIEMEGQV